MHASVFVLVGVPFSYVVLVYFAEDAMCGRSGFLLFYIIIRIVGSIINIHFYFNINSRKLSVICATCLASIVFKRHNHSWELYNSFYIPLVISFNFIHSFLEEGQSILILLQIFRAIHVESKFYNTFIFCLVLHYCRIMPSLVFSSKREFCRNLASTNVALYFKPHRTCRSRRDIAIFCLVTRSREIESLKLYRVTTTAATAASETGSCYGSHCKETENLFQRLL